MRVIRWGMNWTEIISAFVAGVLIAGVSFLKKISSDKKKEWGYNPRCVECPLFQAAIRKVPDNGEKKDQ